MSDLGIAAAQDGMVDQRCDRRFGASSSISGGVVCYNGTSSLSEAVYICNETFHLMGGATRVCQNDGNWNGSVPQCILSPGIAANYLHRQSKLVLFCISESMV